MVHTNDRVDIRNKVSIYIIGDNFEVDKKQVNRYVD